MTTYLRKILNTYYIDQLAQVFKLLLKVCYVHQQTIVLSEI